MALFLVNTWGHKTSVIGSSMENALYNGQTIYISKFSYLLGNPRYGDIVVFLPNGNEHTHYYVKRVVAVPGDTVQISAGRLYINDTPEENADKYDLMEDSGIAENPLTLGDDEYFVLGDNRNNSKDSRFTDLLCDKCRPIWEDGYRSASSGVYREIEIEYRMRGTVAALSYYCRSTPGLSLHELYSFLCDLAK